MSQCTRARAREAAGMCHGERAKSATLGGDEEIEMKVTLPRTRGKALTWLGDKKRGPRRAEYKVRANKRTRGRSSGTYRLSFRQSVTRCFIFTEPTDTPRLKTAFSAQPFFAHPRTHRSPLPRRGYDFACILHAHSLLDCSKMMGSNYSVIAQRDLARGSLTLSPPV